MPPPLLKLVFDRRARRRRAVLHPAGDELAARPWFAGDTFSAADIQMSFPLEVAAEGAGLDASRPRLTGWLARIHARPAYQRALARGGPYRAA